jgi:hypothetical protein
MVKEMDKSGSKMPPEIIANKFQEDPLLTKPLIERSPMKVVDRELSALELKELLNFHIDRDPPEPQAKPQPLESFFSEISEVIDGLALDDANHMPQISLAPEGTIFATEQKKHISIKQKIKNGVQKKRMSIGEEIMRPAFASIAKKLVDRVETNLGLPIKPEYDEGFDESVLKLAKDPKNIFVEVGNHEGLGEGAGSVIIIKHITDLINAERAPGNLHRGSMLTIASSLASGHQGIFWQELIKQGKEKTLEYHMPMEEYTREKDKTKYNLYANNTKYQEELMRIIDKDDKRIADDLYFYLPGNMEEGRWEKRNFPANLLPFNRHIKGLQELHCERFNLLMKIIELRHNRKVWIIPVVQFGGFRIFDPNNKHSLPTSIAIKEIISNHPKSLLSVKVGLPRSYDSIVSKARAEAEKQRGSKEITSKDIDYRLGKMLAEPLPLKARGYYK